MLGIESISTTTGSRQSFSGTVKQTVSEEKTPLQTGRVVTVLESERISEGDLPQSRVSDEQLEEAVDKANSEMRRLETNLRFSIHEKTRQVLVKIVDSQTNEVIREIPPEKLLDMCAYMMEKAGLLMDRRG